MSNRGLRVYDASTSTGELRLNLGDTNFTEFDPEETDYVSFDYFSDDTLDSFILAADDSITRATGFAYRALAGILTMSAVSITTDDLRIDTVARAKLMRELAADWLRDADAEDAAVNADIFDIVGFPGFKKPAFSPEGTPWGRPITGDVDGEWTLDGDGYFV